MLQLHWNFSDITQSNALGNVSLSLTQELGFGGDCVYPWQMLGDSPRMLRIADTMCSTTLMAISVPATLT